MPATNTSAMNSGRTSAGHDQAVATVSPEAGVLSPRAGLADPLFAQFDCSTLGSNLKLLVVDFRSATFDA
jgi:hypothetical protein